MNTREKVLAAIYDAVEEVNDLLPPESVLAKDAKEVLMGKGRKLDSLQLVQLIVAVEQHLSDTLDVAVTLADERAMSQNSSPFRTIGTLADYATSLVEAPVR
jgi:acyl carrier protein